MFRFRPSSFSSSTTPAATARFARHLVVRPPRPTGSLVRDRRRALLVAGDPLESAALSARLQWLGLRVASVNAPREAYAVLGLGVRFDLLVLDIAAPGDRGCAWADEVCRRPNLPPVLLIGHAADLGLAVRTPDLRFSTFLAKPFIETELEPVVRTSLQQASLTEERR